LARRLAEDLAALGVSQNILSKNLNHAKNTKGRSLGKRTNQTFYGLPLGQFKIVKQITFATRREGGEQRSWHWANEQRSRPINAARRRDLFGYIELVSGEYGIEVKIIDEAYSSKCSCLSGDSYQAQTMRDRSPSGESGKVIEAANVFGGKRVARSLYKDQSGLIYHADVGAAANHIRIYRQGKALSCLEGSRFKLSNPLKIDRNAVRSLLDRSRSVRCGIISAVDGKSSLILSQNEAI
jgi:transposase